MKVQSFGDSLFETACDGNAIDRDNGAGDRIEGNVRECCAVLGEFEGSKMVRFDIELCCERKIIKIGGSVLVSLDVAEGREFWELLA